VVGVGGLGGGGVGVGWGEGCECGGGGGVGGGGGGEGGGGGGVKEGGGGDCKGYDREVITVERSGLKEARPREKTAVEFRIERIVCCEPRERRHPNQEKETKGGERSSEGFF